MKTTNVNSINLKARPNWNWYNAEGDLETARKKVDEIQQKIDTISAEILKQEGIKETERGIYQNAYSTIKMFGQNYSWCDVTTNSDGTIRVNRGQPCNDTLFAGKQCSPASDEAFGKCITQQNIFNESLKRYNTAIATINTLNGQLAIEKDNLKVAKDVLKTESETKAKQDTDPTLLNIKQQGQVAVTKTLSAIKTKKTFVIFGLAVVGLVALTYVLVPLFKKRSQVVNQ